VSAPLLEEIVEAGVDEALADVYTTTIAIVVSFDPATHTISAQPVNQHYHLDEDGQTVAETPPVIPNVPVAYLGSGKNRTTFPLEPGSQVVLLHTTTSKDAWQHSNGGVVDPQDERRHDYTDAVAYPGVMTVGAAKTGGSAKVVPKSTVIHVDQQLLLGGDIGTHPVARDIDVIAGVKGVLTDATVLNAFATYQAALVSGIGTPAAKLLLEGAIDTYFTTHGIGSSIVKAK
jgi:hypothetical protein